MTVGRRHRVLLVSSAGGVLLDLLALEPWWTEHITMWAAVRKPDTNARLSGASVHWIRELPTNRPWLVPAALIDAARILWSERPDVIVSAGSGAAAPFFLLAALTGIPSVWLSTFNLVRTPGIAARLCGRLATAVLVQRTSMLVAHPGAIVIGELY
jgi:UDP-N-acetylglucosamine:LPS N-acetylglucosamine transferase